MCGELRDLRRRQPKGVELARVDPAKMIPWETSGATTNFPEGAVSVLSRLPSLARTT